VILGLIIRRESPGGFRARSRAGRTTRRSARGDVVELPTELGLRPTHLQRQREASRCWGSVVQVALNPPAGLVGDDDETCATPASSLHASAFAIAWAMRSVNSTMHCSVRGKPPTPRRVRAPNTTTDRDRNVNRGADSSRPDGLGQALPRHVVHVEAGSAASCRTGPAAWLAWAVCVGTCSYGPEGPRCSNAPGLSGW